MRKETNKFLFRLTVCALSVLATTGCSKDEFFKIEDAPCVDSQTMYEIATSELYIDYQKAFYSMVNELSKIDSTKRGRVVITDGDTIYENVHIYSFEHVYVLFDSLLNKYPELNDADYADLKEIQAIALSNSQLLRETAPKSTANYIKKSKGDNYGYTNKAIEWIQNLPLVGNNTSGSTYYGFGQIEGIIYTFELIPCVTVGDAMNLAVIWSRNHEEVEVGGFGWSDSGMMMYCENAPECECNEYGIVCQSPFLPASSSTPLPLMDFHIHPKGWLFPSSGDFTWWSTSPEVTIHYIISPNYEIAVW